MAASMPPGRVSPIQRIIAATTSSFRYA
jgi:hypothetical protein